MYYYKIGQYSDEVIIASTIKFSKMQFDRLVDYLKEEWNDDYSEIIDEMVYFGMQSYVIGKLVERHNFVELKLECSRYDMY